MAMKKCKDCGTEISNSAKICPTCGKDQRNFFQQHKMISFILAVLCVGILSVAINGGNITTTTSVEQQEKFTLISDERTTDSLGTTYIQGEIKNNTDKTYSYVQVTFNLYDNNGSQLGTAVDNINNLEPNGTWKYKALGLTTEKVSTYKLVEITGW